MYRINPTAYSGQDQDPSIETIADFRQCVLDWKVIVEKICTTHQRADMFTKASPRDAFRHLRSTVSGWQTFARECHEHIVHDGIHKFPQ